MKTRKLLLSSFAVLVLASFALTPAMPASSGVSASLFVFVTMTWASAFSSDSLKAASDSSNFFFSASSSSCFCSVLSVLWPLNSASLLPLEPNLDMPVSTLPFFVAAFR